MKKYYLKDYSENEWRNIVIAAVELGCNILNVQPGVCVIIDSTVLEDDMLLDHGKDLNDSVARELWRAHMHEMILREAAGLSKKNNPNNF